MARKTLPDSVEKRNLLHGGKTAPAALAALGREFEKAGRLPDALDFFAKAGDADGVARMKATAIETGHSFLLLRVRRIGGVDVTKEEWIAAAAAAESAGRLFDAYWCLKETDDDERVAALEARMRPDGSGASGNGAPGTTPGKSPI